MNVYIFIHVRLPNAATNIDQVLEATPDKTAAIWLPTTHHENYPT